MCNGHVSSCSTDGAEENGRHSVRVQSNLRPSSCSRICITAMGHLQWKERWEAETLPQNLVCISVLCVCIKLMCCTMDVYTRNIDIADQIGDLHNVTRPPSPWTDPVIIVRVISYEWVESGEHLLELALHVLVVEKLVGGYEALVQVQRMLTCIHH